MAPICYGLNPASRNQKYKEIKRITCNCLTLWAECSCGVNILRRRHAPPQGVHTITYAVRSAPRQSGVSPRSPLVPVAVSAHLQGCGGWKEGAFQRLVCETLGAGAAIFFAASGGVIFPPSSFVVFFAVALPPSLSPRPCRAAPQKDRAVAARQTRQTFRSSSRCFLSVGVGGWLGVEPRAECGGWLREPVGGGEAGHGVKEGVVRPRRVS